MPTIIAMLGSEPTCDTTWRHCEHNTRPKVGDTVKAGQAVLVSEAMKKEDRKKEEKPKKPASAKKPSRLSTLVGCM